MYKHKALLVLFIFAILSVSIVEAQAPTSWSSNDAIKCINKQIIHEKYCKSNDFKEFLKNNPKIKITEEDCLKQAKKIFLGCALGYSRHVRDEDLEDDATGFNVYDHYWRTLRPIAAAAIGEEAAMVGEIIEKVIPGPGVAGGLIKKAAGEVVKELPDLVTSDSIETINSPITHRLSTGANCFYRV